MIVLDKPAYCYESGCPLAQCKTCGHPLDTHRGGLSDGMCSADGCECKRFECKGKGFVLGSGDPYSAKMMLILEAPGADEIQFLLNPIAERSFFSTLPECQSEIARRHKAFPDVDERLLRKGAPIVGPSGVEIDMWVLPVIGIQRRELFIDNTLRCLPPKAKDGSHYPTGDDRKEAERCCRHWDRLDQFRPNAMVITLHPAGILREVTPLPLQIKDFEKGRDFVRAGYRVAMLVGGKSAKAFLRYGESVTKFRGDYRLLPKNYIATYKDKFEYVAKGEAKRRKKQDDAMEALFELSPGVEQLKRPKATRNTKKTSTSRKKTEKGNGESTGNSERNGAAPNAGGAQGSLFDAGETAA